ncbi:MAG: CPBP family intramembrane glutamic endopeptidase [Anaerolineae bacterium]
MNSKQKIAIISPPILIGVMYPVFQLLSGAFGGSVIGWYLGLVLYWLIWCTAFPLWIVGKESIRKVIRPQRLNIRVFLLVLFPLIGASLYKLIPGMGYQKPSLWIFLLYVSTSFGNGFFEEVLWRGVYMELFPDSILFRIVWPSIWFALWHYAPGSVSSNANVLGLMIGSGLFGFYLSFLAKKTGTIWWSIVAHAIGAIIMIA